MCTGEYRWRAGRGRDVHSHSRRLSPWSFEGIYHAGSQAMKRRYREHGAHATPPSSGSRAWETGEGAQQRMHRNGLFCPFVSGSFLRVLLLHCSQRFAAPRWCSSTGYRRQREWQWKTCSIHRDHPPRSRGLTKCNPCNGSRHVPRGIQPPSCSTSGAIHRVWAAGAATPWLSSSRPRSRCRNSLGHTRPCSKAQWPRRLLMGTCSPCK